MIVSAFGNDYLLQLEAVELLSDNYQFNILHGEDHQQDQILSDDLSKPGCRFTGTTYGPGYSPAYFNICTMVSRHLL